MSSYEQRSPDGTYEAVYGFDNPLTTFYLQVYNAAQKQLAADAERRIEEAFAGEREPAEADCVLADKTGLILWLGTLTGEVPTVEALVKAAAPYVQIPAETIERLRADQQSAPGPTEFQRAIRI